MIRITAIVFIAVAMLTAAYQTAIYTLPLTLTNIQSETQHEDYKSEYVRLSFAGAQKCVPGFHAENSASVSSPELICHVRPKATSSILPVRGDILYLHMLKLF